ncbi:MAG: L-dopachrome tautomerase-related protein [Candidatus Eisenbacteria bacterium]
MRVPRLGKSALVVVLMVTVMVVVVCGCRPFRPLRASREPVPEPAPIPASPARSSYVKPEVALVEVASSDRLWTGVAVSKDGRIFVNYPRWSDDVTFSVGEIRASGKVVPFPDEDWNAWDGSQEPGDHFVCVQSVYVDDKDFLWILDPASPMLGAVVPGGPKLLKVDLGKNKVVQEIGFDETVAPAASYLNDVRVDTGKNVAYITDSGLGALVIVDLKTAKARRLLGDHPSTKAEAVVLTIGGKEWRMGGNAPEVHSDGLALSNDGTYLYYQALTARTLYRVETRWLLDPSLSGVQLGAKVESMGQTGAADGIEFGPDHYLYLTAIEDNAIKTFAALDRAETVVRDPRLLWPDSFARGGDGYMYVTTSHIHLGADVSEPYRIFKFKPAR